MAASCLHGCRQSMHGPATEMGAGLWAETVIWSSPPPDGLKSLSNICSIMTRPLWRGSFLRYSLFPSLGVSVGAAAFNPNFTGHRRLHSSRADPSESPNSWARERSRCGSPQMNGRKTFSILLAAPGFRAFCACRFRKRQWFTGAPPLSIFGPNDHRRPVRIAPGAGDRPC